MRLSRSQHVSEGIVLLGFANGRVRDGDSAGFQGAGEGGFGGGGGVEGHAFVAEGLIAEGEHGGEGGFFEAGAPVVGAASGIVVVDPGVVGAGPAGEEDDVAAWDVEDVAGVEIAGVGEWVAEGGELAGVVDGGEFEATGDEA